GAIAVGDDVDRDSRRQMGDADRLAVFVLQFLPLGWTARLTWGRRRQRRFEEFVFQPVAHIAGNHALHRRLLARRPVSSRTAFAASTRRPSPAASMPLAVPLPSMRH